MMDHTIITIGRQFGSGGHEVAQKLADDYGIALYDHDLLKEIAAKRNLDGNELAAVLAERTHAQVVQVIGKKIVLYKEAKDEKKRKIVLPK